MNMKKFNMESELEAKGFGWEPHFGEHLILETDNGYRLDIRVYDDQLILSLQDKADDSFQPNLLDTPSEHPGVMSKW